MKEPHDSITALSLYVVISVCLFGMHVVPDPAHFFVGEGSDPSAMMWLLVWWPYALIHRINPFLTQLVWSPIGVNLAWTTSIPAPSLLAFPVTYSFGPVVSYNVLSLIAPALSAWSAYCLCAHFAKAFWPSVAGGYIYGFSSYEVGQVLGGHLNLSLIFLLPLLVLLFLRLLNGAIKPRYFVVLFTLTLIMQFLVSNEIFATMTVFGLMTIALAWCLGDCASLRSRIPHALAWVCVCYFLAIVILSPYLYYVFAYGMPRNPLYPPETYSADLAGFILPNRLCFLTFRFFGIDGRRFTPDPWENGTYLGLPLLVLGGWYVLENRRGLTAKVLATSLGLVLLAALGPVLHIAERESIILPWAAIVHLPLLKHALPGRFILYAFLELAVMASMWLARPNKAVVMRTALLALCVLFLWPLTSYSVVTAPAVFRLLRL